MTMRVGSSGLPCAPFSMEPCHAVTQSDFTYRIDDQDGPMQARIYQPAGEGPFAMLVDIHGGAWHGDGPLDRNQLFDTELASRGLVVAYLDFHTGRSRPYPANMDDISCAIRALKANAARFNGTAALVGGHGSSSGGQEVLLTALRPSDHAVYRVPDGSGFDAGLDFVISSCPPLDVVGTIAHLRSTDHAALGEAIRAYFRDEETARGASLASALADHHAETLPDLMLILGTDDFLSPLQPALDFARHYAQAGGWVEMVLAKAAHSFAVKGVSPETEELRRAFPAIISFLSRRIATARNPLTEA